MVLGDFSRLALFLRFFI